MWLGAVALWVYTNLIGMSSTMAAKLESIVHYKSNCHREDGVDYLFHTFLSEIHQPPHECFDILFDMVQRVWWWKPKFFEKGIGIVQGAKLGGMTIGNPRGTIMASIWVAMCEGLVNGVCGKLMRLCPACLVISTFI